MRCEDMTPDERELSQAVVVARRKLRDHGRIEISITPKKTEVSIVHRPPVAVLATPKPAGA